MLFKIRTKIILNQSGQTLIETVVAVFVLVMGIVAALGLAIYALNASANISKQIVAVGLAREGVEAVRNMRDTNWLMLAGDGDLKTDCYNFSTGIADAPCYRCWLDNESWSSSDNDEGYEINPASSPDCNPTNNSEVGTQNYNLGINYDEDDKVWDLDIASQARYGLNLDTNISNSSFRGYYIPNTSAAHGNSDFYRQIILQTDGNNDDAPNFSHITDGPGPRLAVTVRVWWVDKKCPRSSVWPGTGKCSVELQTYLTNWKDY